MIKMNEVDIYIYTFPADVQERLQAVRDCILVNAPKAVEGISYGMPGYKLKGKALVYFAGYKNHVGFYATPTGHQAFKEELGKYKQGKGSVQFPHTQPLPLDLIARIVVFRAGEI